MGLPGTGLSWTDYQPYSKPTRPPPSPSDDKTLSLPNPVSFPHDEYQTPIQSAAAEQVGALSTSELAPVLNAIYRRSRVFPFVLVGFGVLLLFSLNTSNQTLVGMFAVGALALSFGAKQLDHYRRSVAVEYTPSGVAAEAVGALERSFASLSGSASVWSVQAEGATSDWKRHAGATRLNTRKRTYPQLHRPDCIRGSVSFPCVSFGRQELYFLPDAALFIDRQSVAALHYRDVTVSQRAVSFIEEEGTPSDTTVVGQTWRFVNKNGGPDRRFNGNRQLPICLYSEVDFRSQGGLNGRLHLSQSDAGETLAKVVAALAQFPGEEASAKSVTSYRTPKRWPTVAYFLVVIVFTGGSIAASLPNSPRINLPNRDQSASPSAARSAEPAVIQPSSRIRQPTAKVQAPAEGPMIIVPQSMAPPNAATVPLPRLRPNRG
jgi:hypothetical protein